MQGQGLGKVLGAQGPQTDGEVSEGVTSKAPGQLLSGLLQAHPHFSWHRAHISTIRGVSLQAIHCVSRRPRRDE